MESGLGSMDSVFGAHWRHVEDDLEVLFEG